ncbi:MAG TPA: DUF1343 domain-containing protein [Chitinophagaceae bacterium]|nr:DUF1343 domain-containing protein [Chitinophagaceae bacterium]HAN39183.1 DUF1343 domain-containing protein [Chitinophagaceae bacterium]
MNIKLLSTIIAACCTIFYTSNAQNKHKTAQTVLPAAHNISAYLPLLKGKRVGIFANHISTINSTHLVDTLQQLGITISKIFGPEHGFRGTADAGEKVASYTDKATGIQVISLYGKKRKPSAEDVADVDVLLFDIQDVGVRFYTFISSLEEFIEAALSFQKPLVVLDRPNPNGHYIDGPVLDTAYKSFVGMQPVPIVYGMTIGEYALMLIGEKWIKPKTYTYTTAKTATTTTYAISSTKQTTPVTVVHNSNYTHQSIYHLPVKPSPNLPHATSIYWYPSTCLFEGTVLSEGRGTAHPFCIMGHPMLPNAWYAFTPVSRDGAKEPKLKNQLCYGYNLYGPADSVYLAVNGQLQLRYLLESYQAFPQKDSFFLHPKSGKPTDYFFNKLAGNSTLMQQIINGTSEADIRKSWQPALNAFKTIRRKYLLYP